MPSTNLLFVYGTLRPGAGQPMADYLSRRAAHIGEARTAGRLYDLGNFPGAKEAVTSEDWIIGDLFELHDAADVLADLDRYEGSDADMPSSRLFERSIVRVQTCLGDNKDAWVYFYCPAVEESQRIVSGDYVSFRRGKQS